MFCPMSKPPHPVQTSLLVLTQTAVGCAVGLLLAGKLQRPTQKVTAATLLGVGTVLALPMLVGSVMKATHGPGSVRGERRRLESIRTVSGFGDDAELF